MNIWNPSLIAAKYVGIAQIALVLVCVALAWWALQNVRWDLFLKHPSSPQAKTLLILLSLVIGYEAARFIFEYFSWSISLRMLF